MAQQAELPSDYPPPAVEVRLIGRIVDLRGKRVLEIGAGDGRLTIQYASLTSSVVAIEPDPANVALASESASATGITNSSFKVGTAERVRMGGGAFDIALFSWSL